MLCVLRRHPVLVCFVQVTLIWWGNPDLHAGWMTAWLANAVDKPPTTPQTCLLTGLLADAHVLVRSTPSATTCAAIQQTPNGPSVNLPLCAAQARLPGPAGPLVVACRVCASTLWKRDRERATRRRSRSCHPLRKHAHGVLVCLLESHPFLSWFRYGAEG